MPIMNSTGALKIQKSLTIPSFTNWMSVTGQTVSAIRSFDFLNQYNDKVRIDYEGSSGGTFWVQLAESGFPTYYTKFTTSGTAPLQTCNTIDPSGNTHLMTQTKLLMYDINNNFVRGISMTITSGFNYATRIYNNDGYLYVICTVQTTHFRIIKIRISDYVIMWSNIYNTGVTQSASAVDPYNILFHSGGDLIIVGGSNASKTYFFVRMNTSGTIVWQKKSTFTSVCPTGPGSKSVLDSSDNLYVLTTSVVTSSSFTNVLTKIDTSTGTVLAERTISTTSDFYHLMKIQGTNLYLATYGIGAPGPNIILTVIDTSFTAIQNHNIYDANKMTIGGLTITSTNCYLCIALSNINYVSSIPMILKLPYDTNLTTSTSYNFKTNWSGTLIITKIGNVTFSISSVITLVAGTTTSASATVSSVSTADTRSAAINTVKYVKSI